MTLKRFSSILLFVTISVIPVFSAQALERTVSPLQFIRQITSQQNITLPTDCELKEQKRYTPKLKPYACYVEQIHAEDVIQLLNSRGITKGEAAQFLQLYIKGSTSSLKEAIGFVLREGLMKEIDGAFTEDDILTFTEFRTIQRSLKNTSPRLPNTTTPIKPQNNNQQTKTSSKTVTTTSKQNSVSTDLLEDVIDDIYADFLYTNQHDQDKAMHAAIKAYVDALGDPYSVYMPPVQNEQFSTGIEGSFEGIGAKVEYVDDVLKIVSPLDGSPAEKAGLLPGDIILEADGESLKGLGTVEAVARVRGPEGSVVTLTVDRDGTILTIDVTRAKIELEDYYLSVENGVLMINLEQFGFAVQHNLREDVEQQLVEQEISGIILDLRNNPGGLLSAAEEVVSLFIEKDSAYIQIETLSNLTIHNTISEPIDTKTTMVILINGGSASASEIVAATLQDYDRATLIGKQSFGKGSVQQIKNYNDGSALKVTIARWFSAKGQKIQDQGVTPDIILEDDAAERRARSMLR